MLRRLVSIWMAVAILMIGFSPQAVPIASASDDYWEAPTPKGVVGYDGIAYIATGSYQGHKYTTKNYIGSDAGLMASNPKSERDWQANTAERFGREDIKRAFLFKYGLDIPDSAITVTTLRL